MSRITASVSFGLMMCLGSTVAVAATDPCAAQKVAAAGKAAKAAVMCQMKYAKDPTFELDACNTKATGKLVTTFIKAETAGVCSGTPSACALVAEECADAAAEATVIAATPAACRGGLLKASAKYAMSLLKCDSSFYSGASAPDVTTCENDAAAKLSAAFDKVVAKVGGAGCGPLTANALVAALKPPCGAGVVAGLPDTAHICMVCCETDKNGAPLGCSDGPADLVAQGCVDAAAVYNAQVPPYSFTRADPTAPYCDSGVGACSSSPVISPPQPPALGIACCQLSLLGKPACSAGPITGDGTTACLTDFGGSLPGGQTCVNGQTCQ